MLSHPNPLTNAASPTKEGVLPHQGVATYEQRPYPVPRKTVVGPGEHQRGVVKRRKVAVILLAAVLVLVLAAVGAGLWIVNRGDNPVETITKPGSGADATSDSNTISIYAPNELSKVLERVTTAFQQENPGTTFQFTLGPTSELMKRIREGNKPTLYVDVVGVVSQLPPKERPKVPSVPFGYDLVQLVVHKDNPKQVKGLDVFAAGSPVVTGMCAPELLCGRADAQTLQRAGVSAAPKVVSSNVVELTDGIKSKNIDAVLMLRTDLRSVLMSTVNVRIPKDTYTRVDYEIAQFRRGAATDQFSQWLQGSPTARQTLRLAGMLSFYDG
jgi:molybdate transport system substrate-binding protein